MPGQPRLREAEVVHEIADAALAAKEELHDLDANRIGEGMKQLGGAGGIDAGSSRHDEQYNEFS
jgi:hypothetical protein